MAAVVIIDCAEDDCLENEDSDANESHKGKRHSRRFVVHRNPDEKITINDRKFTRDPYIKSGKLSPSQTMKSFSIPSWNVGK